jgi:hypothetical protein
LKAIIIVLLVVGALVGGILTLRSTRNAGMPGKDVLDRAKERGRAQAAKDDAESDR